MTTRYTPVDLSQLPPPQVVEPLSYEEILAEQLAEMRVRFPALIQGLESEPSLKILEVTAYRELLLRQRVNDGARATMLAYAKGADLDHIGALYGVSRLLLDPGDPDARPPVPPVYESNDDFRRRIQLSPEGYSTAGPTGAYEFFARSADPTVKDVAATSPSGGRVSVVVLSSIGNGVPGDDLIATVQAVLDAERIRPVCDTVTVVKAAVINYDLTAELEMDAPPDQELVRAEAERSARDYVDKAHRLNRGVSLSGLYAALHVGGVRKVKLTAPAADVAAAAGKATWCENLTVTIKATQ